MSAEEYEGVVTESSNVEEENIYNKLHFYFGEEEHEVIDDFEELSTAIESIPKEGHMVTTYGVGGGSTTSEEVNVTIEFESDFMQTEQYLEFSDARESLKSMEEVRLFREELNAFSKEYHKALVRENMELLEGLDYSESEEIGYSPFVVLKIDINNLEATELQDLCICEEVENISVRYEAVPEEEASWNETLERINAYDIVSNETYTGNGIKIGIYESGGICDINHVNLRDKDITVRNSTVKKTDHADQVASILAIMVPEAEFYVSNVNQIGIEWFIQQNCDIVNCSFGYYNNTDADGDGVYTDGEKIYQYDIDGVYDYQIKAHFITVCKSAGNKNTNNRSANYNPDGKVTSPGYAYNIITVGGVDKSYIDSAYRWVHANNASYVCTRPKVKPNIAAPYTVTIPNIGSKSGTSYATPQVTACIAMLEEETPGSCTCPEEILSLLTSTAQETYNYSTGVGGFDTKVGAGIVDLERLLSGNYCKNIINYNKNAQTEVDSQVISLTAGTEIEIGLAWLVTADEGDETTYVTDYDLKFYSPSGELLEYACLTSSNIERIRVEVPSSGFYRIVVFQSTTMSTSVFDDRIALTYNY